jgi:hypothetical protein
VAQNQVSPNRCAGGFSRHVCDEAGGQPCRRDEMKYPASGAYESAQCHRRRREQVRASCTGHCVNFELRERHARDHNFWPNAKKINARALRSLLLMLCRPHHARHICTRGCTQNVTVASFVCWHTGNACIGMRGLFAGECVNGVERKSDCRHCNICVPSFTHATVVAAAVEYTGGLRAN